MSSRDIWEVKSPGQTSCQWPRWSRRTNLWRRGACSGAVGPGRTEGARMAKPKEAQSQYEVTGRDKAGNIVFHLLVEAVNSDVAKLYAMAHLQRTPDGQDRGQSSFANAISPPMISRPLTA